MSEDPDDRWGAITRDLRRTTYLAEALELAAGDVELAVAALAHAAETGDVEASARARNTLRAALHYHLGAAWADGAGVRVHLFAELDRARAMIKALRQQLTLRRHE